MKGHTVRTRPVAAAAALALAGLLAGAAPAGAAAPTSVTTYVAFSGSGSAQVLTTRLSFRSAYDGPYYVSYNVYRSRSSAKTSPARVTTTAISQTFPATVSGKLSTTSTVVKSCPPGTRRTTYYYWLAGTVSDGSTGVVRFSGPTTSRIACTQVY
jgi:hypothetical protein